MQPIAKRPPVKVPLAYNKAAPVQKAAPLAAATKVSHRALPNVPKPFAAAPAAVAPPVQAKRNLPLLAPETAVLQMARGRAPQQQREKLEARKARMRAKLEDSKPAAYPTLARPNKPRSLAATHPGTNQPLTFHHKLNAQKLLDALGLAIANKDRTLLKKLVVFSRQNMPDKTFIDQLFKVSPATVGFQKKFDKFQKKLIWTPWNGFFGDIPEVRLDDPKHDLDGHLTATGAMTPRSQLAHDVGPDFRLDVNELQRRLEALASQGASPYVAGEWGSSEGLVYQRSNTTPAIRVVRPDLRAPVARNNVNIVIASNDATTAVTVTLALRNGIGAPLPVIQNGRQWSAALPQLNNATDYDLTITAQGAPDQTPTVIAEGFTSINQLTAQELAAVQQARANRVQEEVDLSDFQLF